MSGITEVEARLRWCPFAVEADDGLCAGSRCMAWRWAAPPPRRDASEFFPRYVLGPFWREEGEVDPAAVMAMPEPSRPEGVPADWAWKPGIVSADGGIDGLEWVEPEASAERRYQQACANRQGCCGLIGMEDPS